MNIEPDIIRRCQQGELKAFEKIYGKSKDMLFSVSLRMLRNQQDAEDAVQTTFIKLYRGVKDFVFKSKFETYLMRILFNVCYDIMAKRKVSFEELSDEIAFQPQNDLQLQLEEAIANLPQKMRECFILFAIEGFKQEAIGEILNISTGSVKSHVFNAKQKLRNLLADSTE